MADVTLTYKGSTIAEMNDTGTKTLKTSGKYCEGDIGVNYVKPASGASGFWDEDTVKAFLSDRASVTSIVIPSGITKIDFATFSGFTNLSLVSLPDSITTIGNSAFQNCTNLSLTSLPENIQIIKLGAFYGCTNLAITFMPASLREIDYNAFYGCTSLTTITFKGKPITIDSSAFSDCTNLTTINVPWAEGAVANAPWGATNATINYNYTE